jgi:hypothetical protein
MTPPTRPYGARLALLLGGAGSGNFGHAGRPGEVGGSAPGDGGGETREPRRFEGNAGYEWHERPEMVAYASSVPYAEVEAVNSYAGFTYADTNAMLRGTYTPPIINEFVRAATPEEIEAYKPTMLGMGRGEAKDYAEDDPTNKVPDGRIIRNAFTVDPKTGEKVFMSVQRAVPDKARVEELGNKITTINTLIRERGYELTEPVVVNRAAYVPGLSYDDVKAMEGSTIEEKGFTSTMLGNPKGRLDGYVVGGKSESLYKRFSEKESGAMYRYQDEVGAPMRIEITLPEGTKVVPVEALRRIDHEFPKIQDPEVFKHPEWLTDAAGKPNGLKATDYTIRDYTAKPKVNTDRLRPSETNQRSEAEILLGSGARFRVVSVRRGDTRISTGDPKMRPIEPIDVKLEYIGGGSSAPAKPSKNLHDEVKFAFLLWDESWVVRDELGRFADQGGSARAFAKDEGYDHLESPALQAYAEALPEEDLAAVKDYAGFGYNQINQQLRGDIQPRILTRTVRPATPEEIAHVKATSTPAKAQQDPKHGDDDPENRVADGRVVVRSALNHTTGKYEDVWEVRHVGPDTRPMEHAARINESIRERGYVLPEPMIVNRAAYIPGLTYETLKGHEGRVIEEKGFTSTMLGNPRGSALDSYVAGAKHDSLYDRTGRVDGEEVGQAMRIQIVLPGGTKVAPVETMRRMRAAFEEDSRGYAKFDKPLGYKMDTDKDSRSEAEILLGSGAQFKVAKVAPGKAIPASPDGTIPAIPVTDVVMVYVGGGSSEGAQ